MLDHTENNTYRCGMGNGLFLYTNAEVRLPKDLTLGNESFRRETDLQMGSSGWIQFLVVGDSEEIETRIENPLDRLF